MPFIVNFSFLPFVHGYVVILLLASFKDVHRMFSPISKVHTKVANPKMRDIPEVRVPSFSLIYRRALLLLLVGHPCLLGTSSQLVVPTSDLPGTPIVDYSNAVNEDQPSTPLGPMNIVVLSYSASSSRSNLL